MRECVVIGDGVGKRWGRAWLVWVRDGGECG